MGLFFSLSQNLLITPLDVYRYGVPYFYSTDSTLPVCHAFGGALLGNARGLLALVSVLGVHL